MRFLLVLLLGLLSNALCLFGVYVLNRHEMNIMGWFIEYVIPLGAGLVGVGAASGFCLGSWLTGQRLDGRLLALVMIVLAAGYFSAEYVEFRVAYPYGVLDDSGHLLGFWSYMDFMTRAIHFGNHRGLGLWGYGVRAVELSGFVCGGVFGTLWLLDRVPYCAACSRYQRTAPIALLDAGAQEQLAMIVAKRHDGRQLHDEIEAQCPASSLEDTACLPERASLLLIHCPMCGEGKLSIDLVAGPPEQRKGENIGMYSLDSTVVTDLLRLRSQG